MFLLHSWESAKIVKILAVDRDPIAFLWESIYSDQARHGNPFQRHIPSLMALGRSAPACSYSVWAAVGNI